MNTRKQVMIMSALLMLMLVTVGIYGAWYPSRETGAAEYFEEATAERGSILFARNCRLCHGNVGEGGALGARLPTAPALDRPQLQGFVEAKATLTAAVNASATTIKVSSNTLIETGGTIMVDEERMRVGNIRGNDVEVKRGQGRTTAAPHTAEAVVLVFDEVALDTQALLITNTIVCGRVGTAMPPWSQEHGGPLSDEQIRQLMVLITEDYWELVEHEIDIEDERTELTEALTGSATSVEVKDVSVISADEAYRIGDERVRVGSKVALDGKRGIITLERGILGTTPLDHPEGEEVFFFPEVGEVSINAASCGQTAPPVVASTPPGLIEDYAGNVTLEIAAQNIAFDKRALSAPSNTSIRVRFDNKEAVRHNIAFYQSSTATTAALSPGAIGTLFEGPAVDDTVFMTPTAAGSYFFRCDVHPTTMTGTFTVQ